MKNKINYLFYILSHPRRMIIFLSQKRIIKISDEKHIRLMYKDKFNKSLNLDNPQTFNEKLQWIKLYDRKKIYCKMVDKYEVKKYVSNIIGKEYIIPNLGVYNNFEEINFDKLPNQFVIKCTHDSGGLVIVKDKSQFNINFARKKIKKCLKRNYYYSSREWPYKNVKPRIIIEPYLEDKKYGELRDYKFFVFNNKHVLTLVCSNRAKDVKFTFFDKNKNFINVKQCGCDNDSSVELPKNYRKMVELAEILSKGTLEVRVDFYEINGRIYFSELTLFDSSGFGVFTPNSFDFELGQKLKIK